MKNNEAFWQTIEEQFPLKEERLLLAAVDPDALEILWRESSPAERFISGDGFDNLEKIVAERYGMYPAEAFELTVRFWDEVNTAAKRLTSG